MKKNIFICHSSKDAPVADAICMVLESMSLSCWIAPRNVPPGSRFPREIIKAIEKSDAFVMVFSKNANASDHVAHEVERAFSKKIRIFPFRIDNQHPTDDLEYFLSITQWFEATDTSVEDAAKSLGDAIIEYFKSGSPLPEIEEKTTISPLIDIAFYPIASALNDIRELELQEHSETAEIKNHAQSIEDAAFQLIEVIIKFFAFSFLSWYRGLPEEQYKPEVDKTLPAILDPKPDGWLSILAELSAVAENCNETPGLIKNLMSYIRMDYACMPNTIKIIEEITNATGLPAPQETNILSWFKFMLAFENEYKNACVRPANLKKYLKESLLEVIACCNLFTKLELGSVTSVSPNKKKEGFDHNYCRWHGMDVQQSPSVYSTSGWDFIESNHVFLFDPQEKDMHLDLFPFLLTDEETGEPLFWYKSDDISHISYKKLKDRNVKVCFLSRPDRILDRIKKHFLDAGEIPEHDIFVSEEDVFQILAKHEAFLKSEVKNPLLTEQIEGRIALYRQQISNQSAANPRKNYIEWLPKINKLKLDMTLGSFAKLMPTKHDDALTDEHGGIYLIPEKFAENRPETVQTVRELKKIFSKPSTVDVDILFYLAFAEALRNSNGCILGVEHFMIALSKICDPFIFSWYDAIGVPPKYHRDATRYVMEKRKPEKTSHGKVIIKDRLSLVFNMIIEEANLGKRDEVNIKDVLSAILREGGSLPILVLNHVFNLTQDRILGDFYHLVRMT